MRAIFPAALLTLTLTTAAFADPAVAGHWHADLGSGVVIDMTVDANNAWSSSTLQQKKLVRQMKGTYTQTVSSDDAGTLVFTPTQVSVKAGSGKVETETDQYQIAQNGKELKLTSDGDTMVFEKVP